MHLNILDSDNYNISGCSYVKMILSIFLETCLIIYPAFSSNNQKIYIIISIILTIIITFINILYGRIFHSYFPLSLIGEYHNLLGLTDSILSIININDSIIIIFPILQLLLLQNSVSEKVLFHFNFNIPKLSVVTIFIIVLEIFSTYRSFTWKAFIPCRIIQTINREIESYNYEKELYTFRNGIINTYIRDCWNYIYSYKKELSYETIIEIKSKSKREYNHTVHHKNNIIFIIVESLMTFPIDLYIDGTEITPTLNKLKKEGYYNPNMISQIEKGMSSDGQFIYFTGLLPHKNNVTIVNFIDNVYHGLGKFASRKNMKTIMVVPTTKKFWHQEEACIIYGIEDLWSKENYYQTQDINYIDEWLNDEQIFNYSRWLCEQTSSPFFLTILTSSMHMPYYNKFEQAKIQISSSKNSYEYINYLQKVNYMDYQLGVFIQYLKDKGLYDNSTIIIASDHKVPFEFKEVNNYNIPLFITNCKQSESNDTIGQIDIYPTILDLLNISDTTWRGVGYSIYSKKGNERIKYNEQFEISNLILESNFFKDY